MHELGWRVELDADCNATVYRPDGSVVPAVPAPADAPSDPLAAFEAVHADRVIDEETGLTGWDGSQPDYDMCVRVGCPREEPDLDLPVGAWLAKHGDAQQEAACTQR